MTHQPVTGEFSVSPQIAPHEVAAIAKDGFRSIVCNRPDGEAPDQPPHAMIEAEAAKAGLEFRYIPVVSGAMTQVDVAAMAVALKELPSPVFAYCRSGTRCGVLFRAVHGL
jgi:sulfide:quinone oxidoreductase